MGGSVASRHMHKSEHAAMLSSRFALSIAMGCAMLLRNRQEAAHSHWLRR